MKTGILITILAAIFNVVKAQITFEQEYTFEQENAAELKEINVNVFKYVILDEANAKFQLINTDHSVWKEITIPQKAGFVIDGISYVTQQLFDMDDEIEYVCEYYKDSPYMMIESVLNEDGSEILTDTNTSFNVVKATNNSFKYITKKWNVPYTNRIYSVPGVLPELSGSGQTLSLNKDTLKLSGSNEVYLGDYKQKISFSNDTIYLTHGGYAFIGETTTSSIETVNLGSSFGIGMAYPNPTSTVLNVEYLLPDGEDNGQISIFDIQGIEVFRSNVYRSANKIQLDLSGFTMGTYQIQLKTSGGFSTLKKVIVID